MFLQNNIFIENQTAVWVKTGREGGEGELKNVQALKNFLPFFSLKQSFDIV